MYQISKIKILLGIIYAGIVAAVTFLFFYYDAFSYINYDFVKDYRQKIFQFRDENIFLVSVLFFIFCLVWTFILGFGSILTIIAGFIFNPLLGSVLLLVSWTAGGTLLYMFANSFLKDLVIKFFKEKFQKLDEHFKSNDFAYLMFLRLVPGIPSQVGHLVPILFNMSVRKFFMATLIGGAPATFIVVNLLFGIFSKMEQGNIISLDVLSDPQVSIPLALLGVLVLITSFMKKYFFKTKE
ncbi:MAG: TVP38/TMEM64 family protein [Candidatus Fonsibacter sp.]